MVLLVAMTGYVQLNKWAVFFGSDVKIIVNHLKKYINQSEYNIYWRSNQNLILFRFRTPGVDIILNFVDGETCVVCLIVAGCLLVD